MLTRLTINLRTEEREALHILSEIEHREPRMQAALIIQEELRRRGLLPGPNTIDLIEKLLGQLGSGEEENVSKD